MSQDDLNVKIEAQKIDFTTDKVSDVKLTIDILPDVMVSVPPEELKILVDTGEIKIRVDDTPPDIELTLKDLPDIIVLPTTGLTGPMGSTGPQGESGPRGFQGEQGIQGSQGVKGDTGAIGPQGIKGDTGVQGPIGPASTVPGPVGPEGPIGTIYDTDQIGTVKAFSGATIPTNWMLADGRSLLRADYPQLFAALGGTSSPWGLPDGTHFKIPDLRGQFILGANSSVTQNLPGGVATVALALGEMPLHSHTVNSHSHGGATTSGGGTLPALYTNAADRALGTSPVGDHQHGLSITPATGLYNDVGAYNTGLKTGTATNQIWATTFAADGGHSHTVTDHLHYIPAQGLSIPAHGITAEAPGTDSKGSGTAHNNMPPYIQIAQIIKVTGVTIDSGDALIGATGPAGTPGAPGAKGDPGETGPAGTVYDSDQIGTIKAFSGTTIPTNWMLADGRSLLRADYPQLFAQMGTLFGFIDSTHFNLPDLRGKFIYGATTPDAQGGIGGEATHTLTESEMPAHTHPQPPGSAVWMDGGTYNQNFYAAGGSTIRSSLTPVGSSGGGAAHNNLPPYILVAQIIKVTGVTINAGGALVGPQGPAGSPLAITESATPPANPQVGDLWLYHPYTGVSWIFRYEPDQSATYPWQYIGGSAALVVADEETFTTQFGVWFLTAGGPSMFIARGGLYRIRVQCWFANAAGDWAAGHMGIGIDQDLPTAREHSKGLAHFNAGGSVVMGHEKEVIVPAGKGVSCYYHTTNVNANPGLLVGNTSYWVRKLWVEPVRVA